MAAKCTQQSSFHIKGFALGLALRNGLQVTQKWTVKRIKTSLIDMIRLIKIQYSHVL